MLTRGLQYVQLWTKLKTKKKRPLALKPMGITPLKGYGHTAGKLVA